MSVTNIRTKWEGGELVFFEATTGAEIMRIKDGTDGVTFSGDVVVAGQYMQGSRFAVNVPLINTTGLGGIFFIPPAPCKFIGAYEAHATKGTTSMTIQIQKNASDMLAASFAADSTNNAPVWVAATTGTGIANLTNGDYVKSTVSASAATYANGALTAVFEWL
jgi:hypothetical protein